MSDIPAPVTANPFGVLFSYRGRIGRGKYWLALLAAIVVAFLALMLFAAMMNSTGAGGAPVFLALPLVLLSVWIFSAATVKRLRDAGWPWWAQIAFGFAPAPWIYATLEYIESMGGLIAIGLLVLFIVPGILQSKPTA